MSEGVPPSKSAVAVAAPKTLRYEQDAGLPVAIEARSNRRTFYPTNGDSFSPTGTNVIRLTLNSQSFVDFSHSYLQFTFRNDAANARTLGLDMGVPFFSRLQIMSGGQELEDIQEYSRLYAMLLAAQGSDLTVNERSLTEAVKVGAHGRQLVTANGAGGTYQLRRQDQADHSADLITAINGQNPDLHNANDQVANTHERTFNIPLVSGIFNVEKYFPLLLTEQGLDVYLTLNPAVDVGVWSGANPNTYEINNVKYIAHEVNLDDSFVNQMKASMGATGGVLSMSSTTYRYYQDQKPATSTGTHTSNISCRVKSLKGLLVRPQHAAMTNSVTNYAISTGQMMGINEVQFRVGSVLYPQAPITFSDNNRGEAYNEIRKCFGTIGSYAHGTMLNSVTYQRNADERNTAIGLTASVKSLFMYAYDFETFAKSATESGLNVADNALPVVMECKLNGSANQADQQARIDMFAMCDCIIYIDSLGRVSTRI